MNWLYSLSAVALAAASTLMTSDAQASSQGPYRMEILVDGYPIQEYAHRGTTYVEALRGREYSIRLTNMTGQRVAVALSVDGMNTIDAKHTTAYDARKWVMSPYETIVISGWQTSSATSRQFFFTSEASSYGAWMGQTRNLGNISAAFFPELLPPPPVHYPDEILAPMASSRDGGGRRSEAEEGAASGAAVEKSAPAGDASRAKSATRSSAQPAPRDDYAATGIGREQRHDVYTVAFKHGSSPAAVVTLRYEFRDTLVKLGVLQPPYRPDPVYRRETSSGFEDYGYAPDPYGGR